MNWKIPLSDIDFGPEEEAAALRVLRSGWLSMGEETQAFENEFADYIGVKHAIAVANGTAALHLALLALGIGSGDSVIQPAVNFVAAANMTAAVGAAPVFVDICSLAEPTLSPDSIRHKLYALGSMRHATRPKAVIVMHYGGYPCRMEAIRTICREHGLVLIEDACHAVGGSYTSNKEQRTKNKERIGSLSDIGCFSFFSNKNLATGEGGMVTTNSDDIAKKIRLLRSHGMTSLTWDRHKGHAASYDVAAHGYNYRIDEIRSAIGREQLKKLDRNNELRRKLTYLYWEKLQLLEEHGWILPFGNLYAPSLLPSAKKTMPSSPHSMPYALDPLHESSCHLLPVVAPDKDSRWRCAEVLKEAGIQTSLHYPYIPGFSVFKNKTNDQEFQKSLEFSTRVITLPLYPTLTEDAVTFVSDQLISFAKDNK